MHVYTQQGVNFKNDWMRKNILQVICTIISPMTENLMEAKLLKPSDSGPCHSVETESFSCLPRGTFGKWVSGYIIFYKKIQGLSTNNISPTCPIILLTKLFCPWDSPGKNTGVGCHFLLQGSSRPRDRTQVSCIAGRHFKLNGRGQG